MEAIIKVQLSEGLTPAELEAFISESERRKVEVSEVVTDALRSAARRFRARRAAVPAEEPAAA